MPRPLDGRYAILVGRSYVHSRGGPERAESGQPRTRRRERRGDAGRGYTPGEDSTMATWSP